MSIRKTLILSMRRTVMLMTIAALVLATTDTPLTAAPAPRTPQGIATTAAAGNATDFSSRHRYRHYRHGGSAAGLAFMGLAIGAIAGAVAAQQRRDDEYYDYSGYSGYPGPGYYDAPVNYYGPSYHQYRPHHYHQRYYRPF